MRATHKAAGFTLIELVIVITIIGILAATALPRYVAMQHEARIAKAQAIYGAMRGASALAHARCLLDIANPSAINLCTATAGTALMDGSTVNMVNQYPSVSGILVAAQLEDATANSLTITTTGAAPATSQLQMIGADTPSRCMVSYTEATASITTPVQITAPVVTVTTTGC